MKKISMLSTMLFIAFITFGVASCKKKEKPEPEKPLNGGNGSNGGNNQSTSCMDFVDLDTHYDDIFYLDFINDNNGWAIGYNQTDLSKYILMNTTDAGANWSVINTDLTTKDAILFVNETDGYRYVQNTSTSASILDLSYTTDKGATWTSFNNPFINNALPNTPYLYVDNWSKSFASNGTETIFFGTGGTGISQRFFILKVDNTSKAISYSHYYSPTSTSVIINYQASVHFSQNGTLTAAVEPYGNGNIQMVQSSDLGTTWTVVQTTSHGLVSSVDWINDNIGYVFLSNGYDGGKYMLKTTDGGITWTETDVNHKFQNVRFADAVHGIGATNFDFLYTNDGGATWTDKMCYTSDGQYAVGYDEVVAYPSVNNSWVAGSKYYDAQGVLNSKEGLFKFTGN